MSLQQAATARIAMPHLAPASRSTRSAGSRP